MLSREAAEQGYTSIWTPDGAGNDAFQLCAMRWHALDGRRAGGPRDGDLGLAGGLPVRRSLLPAVRGS